MLLLIFFTRLWISSVYSLTWALTLARLSSVCEVTFLFMAVKTPSISVLSCLPSFLFESTPSEFFLSKVSMSSPLIFSRLDWLSNFYWSSWAFNSSLSRFISAWFFCCLLAVSSFMASICFNKMLTWSMTSPSRTFWTDSCFLSYSSFDVVMEASTSPSPDFIFSLTFPKFSVRLS